MFRGGAERTLQLCRNIQKSLNNGLSPPEFHLEILKDYGISGIFMEYEIESNKIREGHGICHVKKD